MYNEESSVCSKKNETPPLSFKSYAWYKYVTISGETHFIHAEWDGYYIYPKDLFGRAAHFLIQRIISDLEKKDTYILAIAAISKEEYENFTQGK